MALWCRVSVAATKREGFEVLLQVVSRMLLVCLIAYGLRSSYDFVV